MLLNLIADSRGWIIRYLVCDVFESVNWQFGSRRNGSKLTRWIKVGIIRGKRLLMQCRDWNWLGKGIKEVVYGGAVGLQCPDTYGVILYISR